MCDICIKRFIIRNWLTWSQWRLRNPRTSVGKLETHGLVLFRVQRPFSLVLKARKDCCPSSKQPGRKVPLTCGRDPHFVLFRPSTDWTRFIHTGEGTLPDSIYQFSVISSTNTLTDIPRVMFDEISGHPVAPIKLTHEINHHGIHGLNMVFFSSLKHVVYSELPCYKSAG